MIQIKNESRFSIFLIYVLNIVANGIMISKYTSEIALNNCYPTESEIDDVTRFATLYNVESHVFGFGLLTA